MKAMETRQLILNKKTVGFSKPDKEKHGGKYCTLHSCGSSIEFDNKSKKSIPATEKLSENVAQTLLKPKDPKIFKLLIQKADEFLNLEEIKAINACQLSDDVSSLASSKMNLSMDDIVSKIAQGRATYNSDTSLQGRKPSNATSNEGISTAAKSSPRFIKVILCETDDILLFEQPSRTVAKDSVEAENVIEDNKRYEFLTVGEGRNRRRADAETQTVDILYKSRHVNTERLKRVDVGSYVSNYDMFDTYAELEHTTTTVRTGDNKKIDITTYTHSSGENQVQNISDEKNFRQAAMLTERMLASNIYQEKQKRFRNMYVPDPLALDVLYLYRLEKLWTYSSSEILERAAACLSWCPSNGDILAAGYGIYTFLEHQSRTMGFVCLWSIKNPVNPERMFRYDIPVTAITFSRENSQLLAIGFYNGTVEVRDITDEEGPPVWVSQRTTSPGWEPVWQIEWIQAQAGEGIYPENLLTISQDGTVMRYSMTTGPYLLGYQQLKIDRVDGMAEGLPLETNQSFIEANCHPQALTLTMHPVKSDVYYFVGTDEGCVHKCSVNRSDRHLEAMQVHKGRVFSMQFSPWSPKIFLTCGSDWCIRIWVEGIFEPLIHLSSGGMRPIQCAYWSPTHSTIIIGVTRDAVEIWDLETSILKPVSSKTFDDSPTSLSIARFSNCGRSIAIGTNEGKIYICALEDMPFPLHFQYDALEAAIFKALVSKPHLISHVQSLGFLGYDKVKKDEKAY